LISSKPCIGYKNDLRIYPIFLIGHSRGGAICIVEAATRTDLAGLITWASVSSLALCLQAPALWKSGKKEGVYHVLNGRTGQQMPLYYQLYEDYQANLPDYDVEKVITQLTCPSSLYMAARIPPYPHNPLRIYINGQAPIASCISSKGPTMFLEGDILTYRLPFPITVKSWSGKRFNLLPQLSDKKSPASARLRDLVFALSWGYTALLCIVWVGCKRTPPVWQGHVRERK
jgi:pimeloyl-ACP methyl ester carboxylesterase